jgi:hypothetical protein
MIESNEKYRKANIHFNEESIYIHDDCEENAIDIFLVNENTLWISSEYAFGCIGVSRILNKEEIIKLINFLKQGIKHEIN